MFASTDINDSLVKTLSHLALWDTPTGQRKRIENKTFGYIPSNMVSYAAGPIIPRGPTMSSDYSFSEYLAHCVRFARSCHLDQRIVVQQAIRKILELAEERDPMYEGRPDLYCKPLSVENSWGKSLICLCLAFEVALPDSVSIPKHPLIEL